ncbi:hypothetical protein CMQ_2778 [Grosmannia clavigera kw1407]|uniref:Uncharacterized protein n=1 Tax=Grosmannia clavigera (strain kw1407 / UAMH 11150) TaxID=655863 RepID=F0XHX0_GROCL|nr:uncharacterized protein CMQ_2778 [Grosmannia clavigera kw1407]EFX02849.1 hypothetical protein CMQ_2778 [Grosmannia clavigera kw1407]
MAVLSLTKRGRKTAKDTAQTQAETQNEQPPRTKYWHVPTHAATDALLGAPSGWNREDASKIREHNRRRSAINLAAQGNATGSRQNMLSPLHVDIAHSYSTRSLDGAGVGSSNGASSPSSASSSRGPGQWSRSNSGLSKVSFPAGPANPVVHMSQSYKSMDAALHKDGLLTPASASRPGSVLRASASGRQVDYDPKSRIPTVPSLGSLAASASLSSGAQERKDLFLYGNSDVFEMKTIQKQPDHHASAVLSSDGPSSLSLTFPAQQDRSTLPCSQSPAPRSRFGRIVRSGAAAVAV